MLVLVDGEKRIVTIRKHWFIFFREIFIYFVLMFLPFFLYSIFGNKELEIAPETTLAFDPQIGIVVFFITLWMGLFWTRILHVWTDYYLDKWIITNKRVVDIDQKGFFRRHVAVFRMDRIQDVTISVMGIIGTLLNYGCVHIQTAGAAEKFIIRGVPNPQRLRDLIEHYCNEALDEGEDHNEKGGVS